MRPLPSRNGVDDLELVVGDGELDQERQVVLMQKSLEISHGGLHLVWWGWNEDGIVQRAPAQPHVARPQLAGPAVLTAHTIEEPLVHLAEEPNRDRKPVPHASEPVFHG